MDRNYFLCMVILLLLLFSTFHVIFYNNSADGSFLSSGSFEDEKSSDREAEPDVERKYFSRSYIERTDERSYIEKRDEKPYWREYEKPIEETLSPPLDAEMKSYYTHDAKWNEEFYIGRKNSLYSGSEGHGSDDYESHPRITISNDTELKEYANTYGWPGDGSEDDPYMIKGYSFDGMGERHAVYFGNVNDHLIFKNNHLYNSTALNGAGLVLYKTQNVSVETNRLIENENGIDILRSSNNSIKDNDILQNRGDGILIEEGMYNEVNHNILSKNYGGVVLIDTDENNVKHNTIKENRFGVFLQENSEENYISVNTLEGNRDGIKLQHSDRNILNENLIFGASEGISIFSSYGNQLMDNIIERSNDGAITLFSSTATMVSGNSMEMSGLTIQGEILEHYNTHVIDINNTVNGDPVHYLKNQEEGSIQPPAGQVLIVNSTGVEIQGLDVSYGCIGIHLAYSKNNLLTGIVSSFNNRYGLKLERSDLNLIENNTFQDNHEGIKIDNSENNFLVDNIASENSGGIVISRSPQNLLRENTVSLNQNGIDIWNSDDTELESNILSNNSRYGIILSESKNSILNENSMEGDGVFIEGFSKEYWNTHEIDQSNKVNGSPIYYSKDATGEKISIEAGQIILANSTEMIIEDQNLIEVSVGLLLGFSNNNTITNITTSDNGFYGIRMEQSDHNSIKDSRITHSSDGINLRSSAHNDIQNLTLSEQFRGIIMWGGSHSNEVVESRISDSRHGIYIYQSDEVSIQGNNISENNARGISISSSTGNDILENELWKNEDEAVSMSSSSGNMLKDNILNSSAILIRGRSKNHWNTHIIDSTNTVDGSPIYYLKNETQGQIPLDAGQVILANSTDIDVQGLDLNDLGIGILLGFSDGNTISDNLLKGNYDSSLRLVNSHANFIKDNEFHDNGRGFDFTGSNNNHVFGNEIIGNDRAIYLHDSHSNEIKDNSLLENQRAVYAFSSNLNIFKNNTILKNSGHGLSFRNSNENRLSNNTISNNNVFGIELDSSNSNILDNNVVRFHEDGILLLGSDRNNLTNNTVENTGRFGIYLSGSDTNLIGFNDISNNVFGIWMYSSVDNYIRDNSFNIEEDVASENEMGQYEADGVLLRFDTDVHRRPDSGEDPSHVLEKKADRLSDMVKGRTERIFTSLGGAEISIKEDMSVEDAVDTLSSRPEVLYAEPNYIVELAEDKTSDTLPDDPGYDSLWGLEKIQTPDAWNQTTGSEDVIIGVIDTGIDYHHEDLKGNMWESDEGHHGYNAVNDSYYPLDGHGHGTHVAGTIGAVGDNEVGVVGVNWNVSLMALKMFDDGGSGTIGNAIACFEYVLQQKQEGENVVATSNSWGGPGSSEMMYEIIEEHRNAGILMVSAAGNDGENNDQHPIYPASYDLTNVISVAATDEDDELASFSNYGENSVHVAAPGVGINSTWRNDRYEHASGTSMSTPHVSGLIGLLSSYHPTYTHNNLKNVVLSSGDKPHSLSNHLLTEGRINASNTIETSPEPEEPYLWMHRPTNMSEHSVTSETDIMVSLTDGVYPIQDAEVYVEFSTGEDKLYLEDDGSGSDEPGDGYYTGTWVPSNFGLVELEITAHVDNWQDTRNVSVFVFGGRSGISLHSSDENKIMNNQLSRKNRRAIDVQTSEKNEIIYNNISGNHGDGLYLIGSHKNSIEFNKIRRNNGFGIYTIDSNYNDLHKNNVTDNIVGFYIYRSNENSICSNDIFFNEESGIQLNEFSTGNTIAENIISNNTVEGIYIESQSDNNTVLTNRLGNNYQPISVSESNNMTIQENILSNNENGLRLEKSDNNFVYKNKIEGNQGKGIYMVNSDSNLIQNNNILGNHWYGMDLYPGSSNTIEGNEISNNSRGISINTGSYDNNVLNNEISFNSGHGIYISTDGHAIKGNTISQNGRYGMYLSRSDGNLIEGNELVSNIENSIYLWESDENVICCNTYADNKEYGVFIRDSERNWLYKNKFINNTDHAYDNGDNHWNKDYPIGGNYWDDHVEPDEKSGAAQDEPGSDGIVDLPREIEGGGNMDMYPWTNPELSQPIDISDPNPVDIEASLNTTLSVFVDAGIHPTEVIFYINGEELYDVTLDSDGFVETDELELWYGRSYNWSVEAKNVENGEVLNRTLSRTYSFSTGSQEVESFDIFIDDIIAGEEPIIEIYEFQDKYGYLLDGVFSVEFDLDGEAEQFDLHFEDGYATHAWSNITGTGQFTTVIEIEGVVESYTFQVSSSSASSLDILVEDIVAGESLIIEIFGGKDNYGNLLGGTYDVEINIGDRTDSTDLDFTSGEAVYEDWGILTEVGTYMVELTIDEVTVSDSFLVDNADADYFVIEDVPENISAGDEFHLTLTAFDAYDNLAEGRKLSDFVIVSDKDGEVYNETKVTLGEDGDHTAFIGREEMVTADRHNLTIEAQDISPDSASMKVVPADLDRLKIMPNESYIEAGEDLELVAATYDRYNNEIGDVTEETIWSDDVAVARWEDNVIKPETAGEWIITGVYEGMGATVDLIVEPSDVSNVDITPPEEMIVNSGETINFSAYAYDEYRNIITDDATDFVWNGTTKSGLFDETKVGNYEVVVRYENVTSENLTVTVRPGEIDNFEVNIENIEQGDRPVVEIYCAEDRYGNLIEGEYRVMITIEDQTETGVLMFTDGTANHTWTWMDEDGEYTVRIIINEIETSEDFTVLPESDLAPAEFELFNLRIEPVEAETGDEITIKIDVTNVGDETSQYNVEFFLNEKYIGSDIVTVHGGETVTASYTYIVDEDGGYEVSVGGYEEVIMLNVEEEEESSAKLTGDIQWMIGVFLLSAFIAVVMFFKRSSYSEDNDEDKTDNSKELKVLKRR